MRELLLFIHRQRSTRLVIRQPRSFQAATARVFSQFLAWAHLKRDPALVATARGSHSAAAQSSPTAQGSFNFANTQLFNIVSR